jgi:hypothetical protein
MEVVIANDDVFPWGVTRVVVVVAAVTFAPTSLFLEEMARFLLDLCRSLHKSKCLLSLSPERKSLPQNAQEEHIEGDVGGVLLLLLPRFLLLVVVHFLQC